MIHIVFQKNDVDVLREAIQLDNSLTGEVLQIADDFAVGPIKDIYTSEGWQSRRQWWREVLSNGDYQGIVDDGSVPDDMTTAAGLIDGLQKNPEQIIWIWAAQNKHDVCGYYWLMSQLKEFQGRVFILYLNNLPFINEKGNIFYPVNLFDIPAREFVKAKKLARPITPSEFEVDPEEWIRLSNEQCGVRILEGGKKLVQYDYDFYDTELKKYLTSNWQTAQKIIGTFLHKAPVITGDAYLLWRLKHMISSCDFDVQGQLKRMKDFEIKLKAVHPETEASTP
jgi:hypothetical protein